MNEKCGLLVDPTDTNHHPTTDGSSDLKAQDLSSPNAVLANWLHPAAVTDVLESVRRIGYH
jgi:hypothetical protein